MSGGNLTFKIEAFFSVGNGQDAVFVNFTLNAEHADNLAALFIGQIRTENNAVVAVLHCESGICRAENADSEQQSKYKAQNAFFHILSPFKNKAFRECIKRFRIAGRPKRARFRRIRIAFR